MRADYVPMQKGLVAETTALGWGELSRTPGREVVMGAVTKPWLGEVKFRSLPPPDFRPFAEPDQVKIAWSLEAEPLSPERTLFRTRTRAVATDAGARQKFRSYWKWARVGIIAIRLLVLPAVKKRAEQRFRSESLRLAPAS